MAERKVLKMKGVESGVLSAVSVEAEGEGVEIGLLGAVCIAVKGEGEAVVMGVLGAVSVAERKVLLKLRAKVSRSECLVQCLSVLELELRVKALN